MRDLISTFLLLTCSLAAQSGGPYVITQSVIAGGGSQNLSGGTYALAGTAGQSAAGTESTGGQFRVRGGFWAESPLGPTAAAVSLSGRIVAEHRVGVRRVRISLMNLSTGVVRSALTNSFGYFRFDDLEIGNYLVHLEGRNLQFTPNDVVVSLLDNVSGVEYTAARVR